MEERPARLIWRKSTRVPCAMLLRTKRESGAIMTGKQSSDLGAAFWTRGLDEVDREIARLATICKVPVLDPGVIERVLHNDESVCGSRNAAAFRKLRDTLMIHYHLRDKAVGAIGDAETGRIIAGIVERLRQRIGGGLGGQRPTPTK